MTVPRRTARRLLVSALMTLSVACALLAIGGCGQTVVDPTVYGEPGTGRVWVSGLSPASPIVGETVEVLATACRSGYCLSSVRGLEWSQSNSSVASLSPGPFGYRVSVLVHGLTTGGTYVVGRWPEGSDSVLVQFAVGGAGTP